MNAEGEANRTGTKVQCTPSLHRVHTPSCYLNKRAANMHQNLLSLPTIIYVAPFNEPLNWMNEAPVRSPLGKSVWWVIATNAWLWWLAPHSIPSINSLLIIKTLDTVLKTLKLYKTAKRNIFIAHKNVLRVVENGCQTITLFYDRCQTLVDLLS